MNNKKNIKKYNVGLDIGVTSVGWAVTDINNNLLKHNAKNMWGVRLFEEALSAEIARKFRTARRRLRRRKERINILNSLMYEDIIKTDPHFLIKLKESSLISNDRTIKGNKYNLFKDENFNDTHFYKDYPTMYHLRMDLINNNKQKDIRLVYLAIHHILKYRGNFLYEGTEFKNDGTAIIEKINNLLLWLEEKYDLESNISSEEIINIFKDAARSKANKKELLIKSFNYNTFNKVILINVTNSLLGYKFNVSKIFDIEVMEKDGISFSEELDSNISSMLGDDYNYLLLLQDIYSWIILQEVLKGENYISQAMINKYNYYHKDLNSLKQLYKKYIPEKYNEMFRHEIEKEINYITYTKNPSNCSKEDIYLKIKKDFDDFKELNDFSLIDMFYKIENKTFLDKINTTDNGAIPFQLHKKELEMILENQAQYYNSLKENKDKIINLLEFRIPYYVGPLNNNSKFAWLIKKKQDKIYPWNFEDVVDVNASAEKFILKMIKKCTYLVDEYVMPKNSLLYAEYCLLNELNNLRINDKKISKDTKKLLIEKLFKTTKKVTVKRFKEFLIHEQQYQKIENISGLANEKEFMSSMDSYIDMNRIFKGIDETNYNIIEDIIRWITIFEDKKILKTKIKENYSFITTEQINEISKCKYLGWSNLSKKLLIGLKSYDNETIMDKLRSTSFNFIQIINKKEFGFNKKIEELMPKVGSGVIRYNDVNELYCSPANKRGIWQAIKIVEEIVKIMKCEPENIYIEFARGSEMNKKRKDSRAEQLLKIYENVKKDLDNIKNFDFSVYKDLKAYKNEKEFTEKLYLYFLQNGKCLYSQRPIDIELLYTDNYEVDHILPQSYIKDDSISNKALVYRAENQRKKDNLLLSNEIINHNRIWWAELKKLGLMTDKKFYNLTRTQITENDEIRFINRQLVETRQIIKHVTNLLVNRYKNTRIFSINANANSNFRKDYNIYKIRNLNDYHHAHDAYITSIIGNFINKNFKYEKNSFEYTEYLRQYKNQKNTIYSPYGLLMSMIKNNITEKEIEKIRNAILNYKDCFITKKLELLTGEFYDQTIYKSINNQIKLKVQKKHYDLISLKKGKHINYYGGYSGIKKAYYSIISYIDKKGNKEMKVIGIPIQISYMINNKKLTLEEYFKSLGYDSYIIIKDKLLKYQTYLNENNEQMIMVSDTEIRMNKQLLVNEKIQNLLYLINLSNLNDEEKIYIESNLDYIYDYLLEKIEKEYKTFKSIYEKLSTLRDMYYDKNYEDKINIIKGIIDLLKTGQGNLSKMGLGDRSGRMSGINFTSKQLKNMKFINNSITGMYKRGYKVNGMENRNSN